MHAILRIFWLKCILAMSISLHKMVFFKHASKAEAFPLQQNLSAAKKQNQNMIVADNVLSI